MAKKFTKRKEIISFKNAYHGSTMGALSVMGNDLFKAPFLPLLPHTRTIVFNDPDGLTEISESTACVLAEPVQGEAGVIEPQNDFLAKLNIRCKETGALLILDEIQTGFGRTGKFFGFENYGVAPDIVLFAKALGGGMPIGAFCSSKEIMDAFKTNPPLSHLTTFGGHPVSCAAAVACIEVLKEENLVPKVAGKGKLFKSLLVHPAIKKIRGIGLMIAVELESAELAQKLVSRCMKNGLITDSFLFAENCLRIAPPLIISEDEIRQACTIFNASIEQVLNDEI